MSFNPFEEKPLPIDKTFMDWSKLRPKPYNKETVSPYTRTRIILMNGTEFEAQWFSRNFSSHCPDNDLRRDLALVRRIEEQLQNTGTHQRDGESQHLGENGAVAHIDLIVRPLLACHDNNPLVFSKNLRSTAQPIF